MLLACAISSALVVYVDDFEIAGPSKSCEQVWRRLRANVETDEPTEPDRFLGCYLKPVATTGENVAHALDVGHETLRRSEKEAPPYQAPGKKT